MGESKIEQLNILFKEWEEKQSEEVDLFEKGRRDGYLKYYDNPKSPLQKLDTRNSFTRDGIIDEEAWKSGEKILFILKEANLGAQLAETEKDKTLIGDEKFMDRFWYKDLVVNQDPDKDRIGRKIKMIGEKLSSKFNFKSIAYMNINKRGGLANANEKIIKGYLDRYYDEFIKREIEIIDPKKIVVCCGKYDYVYDLKKRLVDDFGEDKLFFFYHPSALYVTDKKYMQGLNKDFGLKEN